MSNEYKDWQRDEFIEQLQAENENLKTKLQAVLDAVSSFESDYKINQQPNYGLTFTPIKE